MHERIFEYLDNIKEIPTSHLTGFKRVFLEDGDSDSNLTQFAFGRLNPGETCQKHLHVGMIECFFFIEGTGKCVVGDQCIEIRGGTFLQIPRNTHHELINDGIDDLQFVYFGIAMDK